MVSILVGMLTAILLASNAAVTLFWLGLFYKTKDEIHLLAASVCGGVTVFLLCNFLWLLLMEHRDMLRMMMD